MTQTLSQDGEKHLKIVEGYRSRPYFDTAGVATIAFGNTYYSDGRKVKITDPELTKDESERLFKNVVPTYIKAVQRGVTRQLKQHQFDALVSFAYNVGGDNFRKSTLLKLVNNDPESPKIADQFRRWNKSGGKIDKGLINRREKEIKLYYHG